MKGENKMNLTKPKKKNQSNKFTFNDMMRSMCVDYRLFSQETLAENSDCRNLPGNERKMVFRFQGSGSHRKYKLNKSELSAYINDTKDVPIYWNKNNGSDIAATCVAYYILSALIGDCQYESKERTYFLVQNFIDMIRDYCTRAQSEGYEINNFNTIIEQLNCFTLMNENSFVDSLVQKSILPEINSNSKVLADTKLSPFGCSIHQLLHDLLVIAIQSSKYNPCKKMVVQDNSKLVKTENPIISKPLLSSATIGPLSRDHLIKTIITALESDNEVCEWRKVILLYGEGGVGKSYIADRIFNLFQKSGYSVCYECVDDTIAATLKRSRIIFQDDNSRPKVIILDHVKYVMDELDTLRQLLNRNFLILIITRNKIANSEYFEEYMVPSFTSDKLCDYAIDRIRKNRLDLKQSDEEELRIVISQIAEEIRCNTDLFIQISNIICDGILDADEILEILRQRESEHIFVGNKSLSQYYFNLYFSQKSPITDDQRLYICLMSLLPPRQVTKAISHLIFANIDPHDRARQMLSGIDIVKSSHICEEIWLEQEENIYIYVHDNIRTAVEICLPTLAKAINGFDIQLGVFVENIVNQMIHSQKLVNQDSKSDKESYNAFICWQYIGGYIVRHPIAVLNELFKHNQTAIFKLITTAFDGYYFANVYDRAAEMINSAINLCGKESLPIEIIKRSYKIALAAGEENLVCDSSLESATTSTEMKKIMAWRCLENRELWKEDNFVQIESASNLLGFSRAEVFEVKKDYTTLAEFADSLRARNAYIFDIIPAETTVRLHILTNDTIIMRQIDIQKDSRQVSDLFRGTFVLPKVSWKCTPNEMIQNGLKIGRYEGWGIFVKEAGAEKLISYIDKKILKPSEDEDHLTQIHTGTQIGFAATHVDYRSRGLVRFLLNNIDMCHPNENHYFTTHDQNGSMNRAAEAVGYKCLQPKLVRNRVIEHISTLYYWKPALNTAVDVNVEKKRQ